MKVLVLGGHGMAGHVIVDVLKEQNMDVVYTSRDQSLDSNHLYLEVQKQSDVLQVLTQVKPNVIVNAIGVLNQFAETNLPRAIIINGLLPHWLAAYGDVHGARVIHISTDCVFSGRRGRYTESDEADGASFYAKTKSLGELNQRGHLTIRTSIIGPELKPDGIGLFHWFMHQKVPINGYRKVWWNGVTTIELANTVVSVLAHGPEGLVHLASRHAITKYDLLLIMQKVFQKQGVTIVPYDGVTSDKTLINTRRDFSPAVPNYDIMLSKMHKWMSKRNNQYALIYPS